MSGDEREIIITFLIGVALCIAILTSYIPQHVECMQLRSSQGLSLSTVLISSVSCASATLSSLLGDWHTIKSAARHRDDISLRIRVLQIANASMPTLHNLITVVAGTPTYILYYFWFDSRESGPVARNRIHLFSDCAIHRSEVTAACSTWLSVALALAGSVWVLVTCGSKSSFPVVLSKYWGITSAITNTIQWIPQIDATWGAQHEGALSATSLIFSVLVDFLVAAFWITGPRESLWIYMSLATDASLQVALIGMIVFFRFQRKKQGSAGYISSDSNLSFPLLFPVDDE